MERIKSKTTIIIALFFAIFLLFTLVSWQGYFFYKNHNTGITMQIIPETNQPKIKSPNQEKPQDNIEFAFAGDAMFGREIGYKFQANNFQSLFENFKNSPFDEKDISWLNLEGPIDNQEIKQNPNDQSLIFNFSKQTINALEYLKLTTTGLANNHTNNQGSNGLKITKNILESANIDWHGDPDKIGNNSVKRYEKGNNKISLIAINALINTKGAETIIKQENADGYFVIVLPHWGNEYQITHSSKQEELARSWISAGADLIIGSHPHVIQDAQIINNRLVFYSLGNFIFDQTFSKETQQGLILTGNLTIEKLRIVLLPVESKNLKPELMQENGKISITDKICKNVADYCQNNAIELNLKNN